MGVIYPDEVNLVLFLARVWVGAVMLAHGLRHVKSLQSGPGMANWLESIGLRPGPLHAEMLTWTEVAVGPALILGLFTPASYGGVAALMLVAVVTNHWKNGFWSNAPGEGWEYTATLAVLTIALGTLGPGEWSLDDAFGFSFPFEPGTAIVITLLAGVGGTALYLTTFWRPPKKA